MTDQLEAIIYSTARDYITGEAFQVRRNESFGYGISYPVPADQSRYYPPQYRRYSPLADAVLKSLYATRVRNWLRGFVAPGRVLEIGCGDGAMLRMMQDRGWEALGTERTDEMARAAMDRHGVRVLVGSVEAIPAGEQFDLIVMFQVLEHLAAPEAVVEACARHLAPGGHLLISVPNFASWQSRFAGPLWFHLDVPRHLNHFSPESISPLLEAAGLCVEAIGFASLEHDPYGWVQSVLNRLGLPQNRLTRLLMRFDQPALIDLLMLPLAALIAPFGLLLALLSWPLGQGAIMHVRAIPQA